MFFNIEITIECCGRGVMHCKEIPIESSSIKLPKFAYHSLGLV
jgi:hypothetical protein